MYNLRSRYIKVGGVRMHYSEAGENGPPLVLCHGGGPGSSGEAGFSKIMPMLGTNFQVYALDGVGGYGDTDAHFPATEGIQSRVEQLESFIEALCLGEVYLSGNSQGAWIGAKYALEHPERVRKLVLVASSTIASAMGIEPPESDGLRLLRAYDGSCEAMRRFLEAIVYDKKQITDELVESRNACANRPGAVEARQIFDKGTQKLIRDSQLRVAFDMKDKLPKLTVPTIFIWGESDNFAPATLGRQLEKVLPNIKFKYIPSAGHQVQNDQPDVVAKLMTDFFNS